MPQTRVHEIYRNGVLISSTPYTVPDEDLEREASSDRVRQARAILGQWSSDAKAVANQGGNVSQAQIKALFQRFGLLCDHLGDLLLVLGADQ